MGVPPWPSLLAVTEVPRSWLSPRASGSQRPPQKMGNPHPGRTGSCQARVHRRRWARVGLPGESPHVAAGVPERLPACLACSALEAADEGGQGTASGRPPGARTGTGGVPTPWEARERLKRKQEQKPQQAQESGAFTKRPRSSGRQLPADRSFPRGPRARHRCALVPFPPQNTGVGGVIACLSVGMLPPGGVPGDETPRGERAGGSSERLRTTQV